MRGTFAAAIAAIDARIVSGQSATLPCSRENTSAAAITEKATWARLAGFWAGAARCTPAVSRLIDSWLAEAASGAEGAELQD